MKLTILHRSGLDPNPEIATEAACYFDAVFSEVDAGPCHEHRSNVFVVVTMIVACVELHAFAMWIDLQAFANCLQAYSGGRNSSFVDSVVTLCVFACSVLPSDFLVGCDAACSCNREENRRYRSDVSNFVHVCRRHHLQKLCWLESPAQQLLVLR